MGNWNLKKVTEICWGHGGQTLSTWTSTQGPGNVGIKYLVSYAHKVFVTGSYTIITIFLNVVETFLIVSVQDPCIEIITSLLSQTHWAFPRLLPQKSLLYI